MKKIDLRLPHGEYVYVARCVRTGLLKIGHTVNPNVRIRSLSSQRRGAVEFLAAFPGTLRDEHALQRHFSYEAAGGEMFYPSATLLDFVASMPQRERLEGVVYQITPRLVPHASPRRSATTPPRAA